jgi:hypothetical protein
MQEARNMNVKAVTVSKRGTRSRRQRKVSGAAVVAAVVAIRKLNAGEPCFLDQMTDAELEAYVEYGTLPERVFKTVEEAL